MRPRTPGAAFHDNAFLQIPYRDSPVVSLESDEPVIQTDHPSGTPPDAGEPVEGCKGVCVVPVRVGVFFDLYSVRYLFGR